MIIPIIAYIITGLCLVGYIYFTHQLKKGWKQINFQSQSNTNKVASTACSLVIACHNEEANLPHLLSSLANQTQSINEIVFIVDHSTDNTLALLQAWATQHENTQVLSAHKHGKKAALSQAIQFAHNELIICTDADCQLQPQWAETIVNTYQEQPFDILILPVTMSEGINYVAQITRLEFLSLVSSGMSLAALGHPIMCNGANLAFRRSAWLQSKDQLQNHLPSGDDVFLLHAIKARHGAIRVISHAHVIVTTHPTNTVNAFMRQRTRWGSKTLSYTDKDSLTVAGSIFTICMLQIILYIGICFHPSCAICAMLLFFGKWISDYTFLHSTQNTFTYPNLLLNTFILSIFYPFYIVIAACSGLINNSKW